VANTREDSTQVYCVSITFLLAFERNRKTLKLLEVKIQSQKPRQPPIMQKEESFW